MTDVEFREMLNDFDGFMDKHGYVTVEDYARENLVSKMAIRALIGRGRLQAERAGHKCYIKKGTPYPERKRKEVS